MFLFGFVDCRKFFAFFCHLWSRPSIVFNGDLSFKFRFEMLEDEKSSTIFPLLRSGLKVDDVEVSSVLVDMRNDGSKPRRKEVKSVEQARWPYLFNFGRLIILHFDFGPQIPSKKVKKNPNSKFNSKFQLQPKNWKVELTQKSTILN